MEAIGSIPAGGRDGHGDLSGHDRCLRVQRDALYCSTRHAFMDVRHEHGAPPSWWCELRVGGVGLRASVASAGSATQLKMGKRFSLLEHIVGEGAFNARADMSYVLWGRH